MDLDKKLYVGGLNLHKINVIKNYIKKFNYNVEFPIINEQSSGFLKFNNVTDCNLAMNELYQKNINVQRPKGYEKYIKNNKYPSVYEMFARQIELQKQEKRFLDEQHEIENNIVDEQKRHDEQKRQDEQRIQDEQKRQDEQRIQDKQTIENQLLQQFGRINIWNPEDDDYYHYYL